MPPDDPAQFPLPATLALVRGLSGCIGTSSLQGSGSSFETNDAGQSLARGACTRAAEERGRAVVRILSVSDSGGGARVMLEVRRSAMPVSTQRLRCDFDCGTGRARLRST